MKNRQNKVYLDQIKELAQSKVYPFHTPGHKRNPHFFQNGLPYQYDMTESKGTIDLFHPDPSFQDKLDHLADFMGAHASYFLTNGTTGGLLAGIRTLSKRGDGIALARNAHQSVYHAVELEELDSYYLQPQASSNSSLLGQVLPEDVEDLLSREKSISLVVITSPSYEGLISDVKSIANICHDHGAALIVDEAHGAHLPFWPGAAPSAIELGADLVVQSSHKSLPVLTGASLLLVNKSVDRQLLEHNLAIFQSSSPSHLLIASLDYAYDWLLEHHQKAFSDYERNLNHFYQEIDALEHLKVFQLADDAGLAFDQDPSKISILCHKTSMTGPELHQRLFEDCQLDCEMTQIDRVLALSSVADTEEGLARLAHALLTIDESLEDQKTKKNSWSDWPQAKQRLNLHQAMEMDKISLSLDQAQGTISGEYIWLYPPGIPLLLPGEEISSELINYLQAANRAGLEIHSTSKLWSESQVLVLKIDELGKKA